MQFAIEVLTLKLKGTRYDENVCDYFYNKKNRHT